MNANRGSEVVMPPVYQSSTICAFCSIVYSSQALPSL